MKDTMMELTRFSERDMITGLLANFYILDYGFVSLVNADGTVNVTHAKRQETIEGVKLPETRTYRLEVLTLSGAGFSVKWDIQPGDQVLLLGLKDYIPRAAEVRRSSEQEAFIHYTRDTMKAFPLSVFNGEARVKIEADKGTLKVTTVGNIELNGKSSHLVTWEELNQALQTMWTLVQNHSHPATQGSTSPSPTLEVPLDISGAKAAKVTTGPGA